MPNSIHTIVNDSERVVAVFTTHDKWGDSLQFNADGTGHTGDWKIRSNPDVEYVVIYHRLNGLNKIYKASIVNIEGPLSQYSDINRYKIHFNNCDFLGVTQKNWSIFGDCGSNPVRYVNT